MSAVTFDTLKFVRTLEAAGVESRQAEAISAAVRDSSDSSDLVTRKDLEIEFQKLRANELALMKADIVLLKWMMGVGVAGILALVMKAFIAV